MGDNMSYAVKVHTMAGTFALGPYGSEDDANRVISEIANGGTGPYRTQRGSLVRFITQPECLELIRFRKKDQNGF